MLQKKLFQQQYSNILKTFEHTDRQRNTSLFMQCFHPYPKKSCNGLVEVRIGPPSKLSRVADAGDVYCHHLSTECITYLSNRLVRPFQILFQGISRFVTNKSPPKRTSITFRMFIYQLVPEDTQEIPLRPLTVTKGSV